MEKREKVVRRISSPAKCRRNVEERRNITIEGEVGPLRFACEKFTCLEGMRVQLHATGVLKMGNSLAVRKNDTKKGYSWLKSLR